MSGSLTLVSIGPGFAEHVTPVAERAIKHADVVVAYDLYLTWIKPWLDGKCILTFPLTEEKARAQEAISQAKSGKNVVLVSSGDIGVYGMASLVFEDMDAEDGFAISVVPGVTAANACASLLGAPLAHDYVMLSLSDLLCPWQWIEQRARKAAEADLCMALYNVCSKKRPTGVYRILQLVSELKGPGTVCGVVRNAYRPEQATKILTLAELTNEPFDMLTSIIIGNRFTRRKGQWMYTPRGYNSWQESDDLAQGSRLRASRTQVSSLRPSASGTQVSGPRSCVAAGGSPLASDNVVWIFAGTSDGNELAKTISNSGWNVIISTATEHGANLAAKACPNARVVSGHLGIEKRRTLLRETQATAIVDATHPYAATISLQLIDIAQSDKLPYIRFERPTTSSPSAEAYSTLKEALSAAVTQGRRIFLACGSNQLCDIQPLPSDLEIFTRITPDPESMHKAIKAGIPLSNIIAMQGPFSKELNIAMWRDLRIDVVISKESGAAGGFEAKADAAAELNIPFLVLSRPTMNYPVSTSNFEDILQFLHALPATIPSPPISVSNGATST